MAKKLKNMLKMFFQVKQGKTCKDCMTITRLLDTLNIKCGKQKQNVKMDYH